MIRIVKVNPRRDNFTNYMGREVEAGWGGAAMAASIFHNPFRIGPRPAGRDGTREEVILKFFEYWYAPEQKWLRQQALLQISPDAVLGCWCVPLDCHCDIIADYIRWKNREEEKCWTLKP